MDGQEVVAREIDHAPGVFDMTLLKRQPQEAAPVKYAWKVRRMRGKLSDLTAMATAGVSITLDATWRKFRFLRQNQTVLPDNDDSVTDENGETWRLMVGTEGLGGYAFGFWCMKNVGS